MRLSRPTAIILACGLLLSCSIQASQSKSDTTDSPKTSDQPSYAMPPGWLAAGSHPEEYAMGIDESVLRDSTKCGCIKSIAQKTNGFGTLMQGTKADQYRGKRLRLSAWVKTQDVTKWAGLWMRVDGAEKPEDSLAFDNMQNRPIKGTTDWTKHEVVLDVAQPGQVVAFGVLLDGPGTVWTNNFQLEVVGNEVPTTDEKKRGSHWINDQPTNLNFDKSEKK